MNFKWIFRRTKSHWNVSAWTFNKTELITNQIFIILQKNLRVNNLTKMKLFGALLACASALTDDEIAAFKCRSGTYAQYDRVSTNGGTEMNRRASSKSRETLLFVVIIIILKTITTGMVAITISSFLVTKMNSNVKLLWPQFRVVPDSNSSPTVFLITLPGLWLVKHLSSQRKITLSVSLRFPSSFPLTKQQMPIKVPSVTQQMG